jgi:hypothetical protein
VKNFAAFVFSGCSLKKRYRETLHESHVLTLTQIKQFLLLSIEISECQICMSRFKLNQFNSDDSQRTQRKGAGGKKKNKIGIPTQRFSETSANRRSVSTAISRSQMLSNWQILKCDQPEV